MCYRILVTSLRVPWGEKDWKSLLCAIPVHSTHSSPSLNYVVFSGPSVVTAPLYFCQCSSPGLECTPGQISPLPQARLKWSLPWWLSVGLAPGWTHPLPPSRPQGLWISLVVLICLGFCCSPPRLVLSPLWEPNLTKAGTMWYSLSAPNSVTSSITSRVVSPWKYLNSCFSLTKANEPVLLWTVSPLSYSILLLPQLQKRDETFLSLELMSFVESAKGQTGNTHLCREHIEIGSVRSPTVCGRASQTLCWEWIWASPG